MARWTYLADKKSKVTILRIILFFDKIKKSPNQKNAKFMFLKAKNLTMIVIAN